VLDVMARLVDKSLVIAETQGSEADTACWRLYDTTRRENWRRRRARRNAECPSPIFPGARREAEVLFRGAGVVEWAERIAIENDICARRYDGHSAAGMTAPDCALPERCIFLAHAGPHQRRQPMARGSAVEGTEGVYFARAKAYSGWFVGMVERRHPRGDRVDRKGAVDLP